MLLDLFPWLLFVGLVSALLALDLGVFHRDAHAVSRREALIWSGAWIGLALTFNAGAYAFMGVDSGLAWTTGYLLEKSLSIDNIFVILLIFSTFAVPPQLHHRVLFWGILGAVIMRALLIAAAGFLLSTLHFVIYLFGGILIFTALRFLRDQGHEPDLSRSRVLRVARSLVPTTDSYEGQKFFVSRLGVRYATPLFMVLLLVEATDLVFAVDSIPAIYAVTDEPFIVFTSNIFAILGLRSLYFVLNGYLAGLAYLKPALAAILFLVGTKLLLVDVYKIPSVASLAAIALIMAVAIAASVVRNRREKSRGQIVVTPASP